jgi:hypothetical protein
LFDASLEAWAWWGFVGLRRLGLEEMNLAKGKCVIHRGAGRGDYGFE